MKVSAIQTFIGRELFAGIEAVRHEFNSLTGIRISIIQVASAKDVAGAFYAVKAAFSSPQARPAKQLGSTLTASDLAKGESPGMVGTLIQRERSEQREFPCFVNRVEEDHH